MRATIENEVAKERTRDHTQSVRVLLVEDDDVARNFAARALTRHGYKVLAASTGAEALDVMERAKGCVDIVISDVVMPEIDGPTLLKELRKTNPTLKIILASGHADDVLKKNLENHKYSFLPKPFKLTELITTVREQLER